MSALRGRRWLFFVDYNSNIYEDWLHLRGEFGNYFCLFPLPARSVIDLQLFLVVIVSPSILNEQVV